MPRDITRILNTLRRYFADDRVLSLDILWTLGALGPSTTVLSIANATHVAIIQLAPGSSLPEPLQAIFEDPSITWVAHNWSDAKDDRLRATCGIGRGDFAGDFLDLSDIAQAQGLPASLEGLAQQVLGVVMRRNPAEIRWDKALTGPVMKANKLCPAVMSSHVPGAVYRALRAQHAGLEVPDFEPTEFAAQAAARAQTAAQVKKALSYNQRVSGPLLYFTWHPLQSFRDPIESKFQNAVAHTNPPTVALHSLQRSMHERHQPP